MATGGRAQPFGFEFTLPIKITCTDKKDIIQSDGYKKIANRLYETLSQIEQLIQNKYKLTFVHLVDIVPTKNSISITCVVHNERELDLFFASAKSGGANELSNNFSRCADERGVKFRNKAGKARTLSIKIVMNEKIYHEGQRLFHKDDGDIRSSTTPTRSAGSGSDLTIKHGLESTPTTEEKDGNMSVTGGIDDEGNRRSERNYSDPTSAGSPHQTPTDVPDDKRDHQVTSENNHGSRQPGSYVHTGETIHTPMKSEVSKQFIVSISPISDSTTISEVYINSKSQHLRKSPMTEYGTGLFAVSIWLPQDYSEDIEYWYEYKTTAVWLFGSRSSTKHRESECFQVQEAPVQRDISTKGELSYQVGLASHIIDIMKKCSSDPTALCLQIDNMSVKSLFLSNAEYLLREYFNTEDLSSHEVCLLIVVMIGNVCQNENKFVYPKWLTSTRADMLLEGLQKYRLDHLPSSCSKYMPTICKHLCNLALGSHYCCVTYLDRCYPFLSEQTVYNELSWYVTSAIQLYKDIGSERTYIIRLCEKLMVSRLENASKYAEDILKMLLRNCPLETAIEFCSSFENTKRDLTATENEFWIAVAGSVSSQILKGFKTARGSSRIANVLDLWNKIRRVRYFVEKYSDDCIKDVIDILRKCNHQSSENVGELLQELCTNSGIFDAEAMRGRLIDLIQVLVGSTVPQIQRAFIALARINPVKGVLFLLDKDVFLTWLKNAIWANARYGWTTENAIISLYKFYGELKGVPQIAEMPSVVQCLDDFVENELNKQELKEVLRVSTSIEGKADLETSAKELYKKQSKMMLETKCLNPYEALTSFCSTYDGELRVHSKVVAELVNTVMDKACNFPEDGDKLDMFNVMVSEFKLWKMILNVTGFNADIIRHNSNYIKAIECIKMVLALLRDHDMKYCSIKQLEKHGELAKQLLTFGRSSLRDIEALWNENKAKCHAEHEKLSIVKSVLEQVQTEVGESYLPGGFSELVDDIKDLEIEVGKGNVTAKQCMSKYGLWGDMADLPDICKFLERIVPSRMFWNLCKESICEKCLFANEDDDSGIDSSLLYLTVLFEENDTTTVQKDALSSITFLRNLQSNGQDLYQRAWSELQENGNIEMPKVLDMMLDADINAEIVLAESYFPHKIKRTVRETLLRIHTIEDIKTTVDAMQMSLNAFKIETEADQLIQDSISSFEQLCKSDTSDLTFSTVTSSLQTVFHVVDHLSQETINVLCSLGKSSLLLEFLRGIVDDDIRNLIDAVEDISEQYVRESTVSGLIEVKRFLQPLLKPDKDRTGHVLFQTLEKQSNAFGKAVESLPMKIDECMENLHNLKSLYNNVANRGEQTKEIIQCIVKKGSFQFHLDPESSVCIYKATYTQSNVKTSHSSTTLVDLRSRALLLMNTEKAGTDKSSSGENLIQFVTYVDTCLDIAETVQMLFVSGNVKYSSYKKTEPQIRIADLKNALDDDLRQWQNSLEDERRCHYLMNFVQGIQIHTFHSYLEKHTQEREVSSMLKYIHPEMDIDTLKNEYMKVKATKEVFSDREMLACIGHALHLAYEGLALFQRHITVKDSKGKRITETVRAGKLLVADLDERSLSVVKTILSLYSNSTQKYPEANQMLFCTNETSWNELQLLLNRCLGAYNFYGDHVLFSIANVEMLPNEIQFKLVEALRDLNGKEHFMLAVVCRGSSSHPFKDELSEYVETIRPASDQTVREIFESECPHVRTITSEVAGLGKSTRVHTIAQNNRNGVVTLHISGPIRKGKLVEGLRDLHIEPYHVLHLDIGSVDNPIALDTFLFELIILRYVATGTVSVSLPTSRIFLEIANTINDTLRNSLHTAVSFAREHITWNNYSDFVVSKEINSAVQIVCHYLQGLNTNSLDKTDVCFSGDNAVKPLSVSRCRILLKQYMDSTKDMSFSVVNIFLQVLSDQLKKMSCSTFFRTSRITDMVGHKTIPVVRSTLVRALVDVSKEFSSRSVAACRDIQSSTLAAPTGEVGVENTDTHAIADLASRATKRVESMIRWEDSNHLIYVFHNQNIQTISPMYRDRSKVPSHIRTLFEGQMKKELQEYRSLRQDDLQNMLQKVARTNPLPLPSEKLQGLAKEYALTPDNLLKMVLIMLRIKANVPVIVMGETGCGKTSLMRYLSAICEVSFHVFNIHAGVEEQAIIDKVLERHDAALEALDVEQWLFLDEINTCEYLGLISDVVCHHRCVGNQLAPNLIVMCACNPYKLRTTSAISTAGLQGKVKTDELSRLVYRVLPLPEMMVDYVWDFGSLSEKDEIIYIKQMVLDVFPGSADHHGLFSELLAMSQHFVRDQEKADCSVSLRDVQRCRILTKWFLQVLNLKGCTVPAHISRDKRVIAIILALAHCYHSRFADKRVRQRYRMMMKTVFEKHTLYFRETCIHDVIKGEQRDILNRMDLPAGTAKNTALQENVFVILVCILNKIPVFVVGKPGCSKSLAMQVIRSNLRGKDSKDEFFKTLPQLYCVSFQGSESSTSDGILKVFEKAENYQKSNSEDDVLSVVILDEIGLAEVSRFNPLKVLHNLLEPDGRHCPNVAVVGISNWSLDASKMNRAIHLSRPDMDVEELTETGISISDSFMKETSKQLNLVRSRVSSFATTNIKTELKGIATAYFNYTQKLRFENFHGLRDYYSLVKYVSGVLSEKSKNALPDEKMAVISKGMERNFGGLQTERQTLHKEFQTALHFDHPLNVPIVDLVKENISDGLARHLMLITSGESVLGIVEQQLKDIGREKKEIIVGSQFEEDLTDDYNYRILSRIILCMEQGIVLILKDLENIYGSLYDMLNQNYTVIGKKKNCRVALGPYSNPMCQVHDAFRCIVLVDENNIDYADPPFLNRFEKQCLRFSDIINKKEEALIKEVKSWVRGLSAITERHFTENDTLPVYNDDLIASLLLHLNKEFPDLDDDEIIAKCQTELLWIIKPEAVIRLSKSKNAEIHDSADDMQRKYFSLPVHRGIKGLIDYQFEDNLMPDNKEGESLMTVVFTSSNIHTKVNLNITDKQVQIDKLGAFKSEKQLSLRMQKFWLETDCDILFLQCSAVDDDKHIMLSKSVIERYRNEYLSKRPCSSSQKHVYLVIHIDRNKGIAAAVSQINYLSEWKLVMLDSLECPVTPLPQLWNSSLTDIIMRRPLEPHIKEQLFWAFTRIKYESIGRDVESIITIADKTSTTPEFLRVLGEQIFYWIKDNREHIHDVDWQINVACDMQALQTSSCFVEALERHILNVVNVPLSKTIYQMENKGIIDSFFVQERTGARREVWRNLLNDIRIFSIGDIPNESGPECYQCTTADLALKMPFSKYIFECTEATREEFLETLTLLKGKCELEENEDLPKEIFDELLLKQEHFLLEKLPDMTACTYDRWEDDYIDDFCNISSFSTCSNLPNQKRIQYMKWAVSQKADLGESDPSKLLLHLHTALWTHSDLFHSELQLLEICCEVISDDNDDLLQTLTDLEPRSQTDPDTHDEVKEDGYIPEVESTKALPLYSLSKSVADENEEAIQSGEEQTINYLDESTHSSPVPELAEDNVLKDTSSDDDSIEMLGETEVAEQYPLSPTHSADNPDNANQYKNTIDSEDEREVVDADDIEKVQIGKEMTMSLPHESVNMHESVADDKTNTEGEVYNSMSSTGTHSEVSPPNTNTDEVPVVSEHPTLPDEDNDPISQELTSQDLLVALVCRKMLPTSATLDTYKGIQNWQRKINCVLAIAARVSTDPASLHSLRFCNDMVSSLFIPYSLNATLLQNVGNLLGENVDLDSEHIFLAIKDIVNDAPSTARSDCQKILVNYCLRCLTSNPSSLSIAYLLRMVSRSEMPDNVFHMKSPLQLAFQYEMADDEDTFLNLIDADSSSVAENTLFNLLESFLDDIKAQNQLDSPCVVVLIDILEDMYSDILQQDQNDEDGEDNEESGNGVSDSAEMFLQSHYTLTNSEFGLNFIASLAFCKAYIQCILDQIDEIQGVQADMFSAAFTDKDHPLIVTLMQYVYKVIAMDKLHGHFTKTCDQLGEQLPFLKSVEWNANYATICFDACPTAVHAPVAIKEVVVLFNESIDDIDIDNTMEKMIKSAVCKGGSQEMMAVYSFAINKFYIHRCFEIVDDTMNTLAKRILQLARDCHMETKKEQLLRCLLGKDDFDVPNLMLEESSSPSEAIIASFLISLYAVLLSYTASTAHGKQPVLVECLLHASTKGHYLPGFPDNENNHSTFLKQRVLSKCYFTVCSCGHRLTATTISESTKCVICGTILTFEESSYVGNIESTEIKSGYIICDEINRPDFSARGLGPALCNVLGILVKGCILGSVALGFMPAHILEKETGLPELDGPHMIWADIENHWQNLENLLNMDMHGVGMLLHTVVLHTREFLTQDVSVLSSPKDRLTWEGRFSSQATHILNDRFQLMKRVVSRHNAITGCSVEAIENNLHEFNDLSTMDDDERQSVLPTLFRVKGCPSMENFLFELNASKESFPFLVLTLEHEQDLQLCKHILSIVRWHVAATANANYLMKKQECLTMTVSEFIHQSHEKDKIELLKDRFDAFKESWETVRKHPDMKVFDIEDLEMKRVNAQANVSECLVLNDDSVVYKVLQLLVEKQNKFLDRTLELAYVCSSVMFLRREEDATVIPCVQICEIKKEDLIHFQWDDMYLQQFAQCDTMYGQGQTVLYDFQTIERKLALDVIVGKAYIGLENNLPKIMFKDELYKNYTLLVKELKSKVKQSPLTNDIIAGVKTKKECDPSMTTNLLTHLGIVMTLLKKTAGDPYKTLVDFVDEWKNVSIHKLPPELLPSPVTAVKLTHLVALHELLEELNSDTVREALDERFREELDIDTENHFKRPTFKSHQPAVVLKTIKIFIHRCLYLGDVECNQPLNQYLSDGSFWPDGVMVENGVKLGDEVIPLKKVIPDEVMVSHVYNLVELMENAVEQQTERNLKMTELASGWKSRNKTSTVSKAGRKKQLGKKMTNF